MSRYHLREDGSPGVCKAKPGNCPLGNELAHYSTPLETQSAFERLMSEDLWQPISHFRFKLTPWENIPWAVRRTRLEKWAQTIASQEQVELPKIVWHKSLDPYNTTLGKTVWEDAGNGDYIADSLQFTEYIEALSEKHAKEIVMHELAHLITGSHHEEDDHGDGWASTFEQLIEHHADTPGITLRRRTKLDDEEYERFGERDEAHVEARWRGECDESHIIFVGYKPPARAPCLKCFTLKKRSQMIWTKWR